MICGLGEEAGAGVGGVFEKRIKILNVVHAGHHTTNQAQSLIITLFHFTYPVAIDPVMAGLATYESYDYEYVSFV